MLMLWITSEEQRSGHMKRLMGVHLFTGLKDKCLHIDWKNPQYNRVTSDNVVRIKVDKLSTVMDYSTQSASVQAD